MPSKKAIGKLKPEFIKQRCFLLNLFIRQVARCPYLVESAEFQIFVRPSSASSVQKELSTLPWLSSAERLQRMQGYFTIMGSILDPIIHD